MGSEDKMQHILRVCEPKHEENSNVSLFLGEKQAAGRLSLLRFTITSNKVLEGVVWCSTKTHHTEKTRKEQKLTKCG